VKSECRSNDDSVKIDDQERPIAICSATQQVQTSTTGRNNIIACCSSIGSLVIVNSKKMDVIARYDIFSKKNEINSTTIANAKGNAVSRDLATAMVMGYDQKKIAIGGRERSATLTDVETGKCLWKAKNLPPNRQTLLQQPIWSTALQFLSPIDNTPEYSNLLAIGTAYKQVQIYDVRANATQRRPIIYTPEWDRNKKNLLEHRVTSLCQIDSNRLVVGDSAGFMNTLDLRKITNKHGRSLSANIGRFRGPAGSVRQIIKHESLPIIACVGLDRMLRVFDINSRKQLDCIYLKQRLNCMLFCSDGTWETNSIIEEDNESNGKYQSDDVNASALNGNIDEEDEVEDYVDSSDYESGSEQGLSDDEELGLAKQDDESSVGSSVDNGSNVGKPVAKRPRK